MRDYLNEGVDPDEGVPLIRCPGPAHPNAHGCGRWLGARESLCARCDTESRAYWAAENAAEQARAAAALARENAYWAAERVQHPDMETTCDCCGHTGMCQFDGEAYCCIDSTACYARTREDNRPPARLVAIHDDLPF